MNKKIIMGVLCGVVALGIAGCGNSDSKAKLDVDAYARISKCISENLEVKEISKLEDSKVVYLTKGSEDGLNINGKISYTEKGEVIEGTFNGQQTVKDNKYVIYVNDPTSFVCKYDK
ncbi:MAG: hypothetical protein WBO70_06060 [Erysipelotrichaceae bacterium]